MHGLITALITPFCEDRSLDEDGFRELMARQLSAGVDGIVVLGTTGEAPTLTEAERDHLIHLAVEEAKGRTKVIVGTGCNCTERTILSTQRASDLGADAALVVSPYYNRPTQEGLYQHFSEVASRGGLPIILYNHPGRCSVNIEVETVVRLAENSRVIGIKEASGSLAQAEAIHRRVPDLALLSGDDLLTVSMRGVGGSGVISVLSNLLPEAMRRLVHDPISEAETLHSELLAAMDATVLESNPIAIKAMMNVAELPAGPCRLPLTVATPATIQKIESLFAEESLLHGTAQPQPC